MLEREVADGLGSRGRLGGISDPLQSESIGLATNGYDPHAARQALTPG